MTDTRNRNTLGNFAMEQRMQQRWSDQRLYRPQQAASVPGRGLGQASVIAGSLLAANSIQIDNDLRGIGVANLVKENAPRVVPILLPLDILHIAPAPRVHQPRPAPNAKSHARPLL